MNAKPWELERFGPVEDYEDERSCPMLSARLRPPVDPVLLEIYPVRKPPKPAEAPWVARRREYLARKT